MACCDPWDSVTSLKNHSCTPHRLYVWAAYWFSLLIWVRKIFSTKFGIISNYFKWKRSSCSWEKMLETMNLPSFDSEGHSIQSVTFAQDMHRIEWKSRFLCCMLGMDNYKLFRKCHRCILTLNSLIWVKKYNSTWGGSPQWSENVSCFHPDPEKDKQTTKMLM